MCKNSTMLSKIEEYLDLKKQIDQLQYQVDDLKKFMQDEMDRREVNELIVGPYKVSYKEVCQKRINSKELKEKYPEVYSFFLTESTHKTFLIK